MFIAVVSRESEPWENWEAKSSSTCFPDSANHSQGLGFELVDMFACCQAVFLHIFTATTFFAEDT